MIPHLILRVDSCNGVIRVFFLETQTLKRINMNYEVGKWYWFEETFENTPINCISRCSEVSEGGMFSYERYFGWIFETLN